VVACVRQSAASQSPASESSLAEVANRLDVLAETLHWRTAEGGELGHIVAAAGR
jgi:hypothetical protein